MGTLHYACNFSKSTQTFKSSVHNTDATVLWVGAAPTGTYTGCDPGHSVR